MLPTALHLHNLKTQQMRITRTINYRYFMQKLGQGLYRKFRTHGWKQVVINTEYKMIRIGHAIKLCRQISYAEREHQ